MTTYDSINDITLLNNSDGSSIKPNYYFWINGKFSYVPGKQYTVIFGSQPNVSSLPGVNIYITVKPSSIQTFTNMNNLSYSRI
jgi:hypothetical protein